MRGEDRFAAPFGFEEAVDVPAALDLEDVLVFALEGAGDFLVVAAFGAGAFERRVTLPTAPLAFPMTFGAPSLTRFDRWGAFSATTSPIAGARLAI
ncbi:MAG: hypothetical protein M3O88_00775 [Actinomycetota bacterium]|nr:hypothetical protein [Actinomycetota bacterium]